MAPEPARCSPEPSRGHRVAARGPRGAGAVAKRHAQRSLGYANAMRPTPRRKVQTGPGRPDWSWQRVTLGWSGPVERGQELVLWLLPPWLAGALADAARRAARRAGAAAARAPAATRAGAAAAAHRRHRPGARAALASHLARRGARRAADARAARRSCASACSRRRAARPSCATASRLALAVQPERLELRLAGRRRRRERPCRCRAEVRATRRASRPTSSRWTASPRRPCAATPPASSGCGSRRAATRSLLAGPLPPRANVEIPLPLRPQRVELIGPPRGWTLLGVRRGRARVRRAPARARRRGRVRARPSPPRSLEPTAIPPFVSVERTLSLGLSWQVTTAGRAHRAARRRRCVLEVPLLPGESVTTPGVRVADGRALVTLAPGAAATGVEQRARAECRRSRSKRRATWRGRRCGASTRARSGT